MDGSNCNEVNCTLFSDTESPGTRCKLHLSEEGYGGMEQNPSIKYTPEFRRETAGYVIASGSR